MTHSHHVSAFRAVPRTGVIFVVSEAARLGYQPGDASWCNLGQGQPETGPLPGAPPRVGALTIDPDDHEYAPVAGLPELRDAVAQLYNHLYRQGRGSQYSAENVAICGGGRLSLTRACAAIGHLNLGHFLPDYTAYEELLEIFRSFTAIPIPLDGDAAYDFTPQALRKEILGLGLGAVLLSNPNNPTGKLICGDALEAWVATARELDCALLIDEFYSNYIWDRPAASDSAYSVSAATCVDDVNRDPVILFNGLTKNWRYPGWRISWIVGPRAVIEAVSSAGSFLDGGGSRPLQRAAVPILSPEHVKAETRAVHKAFAAKRQLLIEGLAQLGVGMELQPQGTFYVWGKLDHLPEGFRDGMEFFRKALHHKVIVVPGEFFDVNPGKRRPGRSGHYRPYARFSFGPPIDSVREGLSRLSEMIHG